VGADLTDSSPGPKTEDVNLGQRTHWPKFDHLDRMVEPGLIKVEFLGLFVKCDACGLITMNLMFSKHVCITHMVDGLDLTDGE
jgi:hypothetical protein